MTFITPTRLRRACALVLTSIALSACGDSANPSIPIGPAAELLAPPRIESFEAQPTVIEEGSFAQLSWAIDDGEATVTIAPLRGPQSGATTDVSPVVTTTFTLTATNAAGTATKAITVTVVDAGVTAGSGGTDSNPPADTSEGGAEAANQYATSWTDAAGNLEGLPSECGNLSYVTAHPSEDTVIVGVALQGLWSNSDGSDTWVRMGQGAGSDIVQNRPSSIIFDPDAPNTFWVSGTYDGPGVFRTDDNGSTFTALGNIIHSDLVAIDLGDPERRTMLSGIHEQGILFRTTDGGATWLDISAGLPTNIGFAAAPVVIDAQTYLLGTRSGSASGVFRSTDGGTTWVTAFEQGVVGKPLVSPDGTIFWLLDEGEGMIVSTDDGATWAEAAGTGPRSILSGSLLALPDGRLAAIGGSFIVTSADGGATWQRVGPAFPYEPNGLAYSADRDAFYAWRFDCDFETDNPIQANAIIRLDPA